MDGLDLDTSFFSGPSAMPSFSGLSLPELNLGMFGGPPGVSEWASGSGLTNLPTSMGDIGQYAVNLPGTFSGTPTGEAGGSLAGLSEMARTVAPILGVGTSLAQIPLQVASLSEAGRGRKALESGMQTAQAAAAPAIAAEQALLPAGTKGLLTGELPPELEANVQHQVNQVRQARLAQLTKAGIDPATAEAMIATELQELEHTLRLQAAQSLLGGGMGVAGQAAGAAGTAGELGLSEFTTAGQSLSEANRALLRLTGSAA